MKKNRKKVSANKFKIPLNIILWPVLQTSTVFFLRVSPIKLVPDKSGVTYT
jgi:hypothetical protein